MISFSTDQMFRYKVMLLQLNLQLINMMVQNSNSHKKCNMLPFFVVQMNIVD